MTSEAPWARAWRAIAKPMPELPPMTTTLLPWSSMSESARHEHGFAGHPARAVGCQKHHDRCDVARLPHPAERCLLRRHPLEVAADNPPGMRSFGFHDAGTDGIHPDLSWAELFREHT